MHHHAANRPLQHSHDRDMCAKGPRRITHRRIDFDAARARQACNASELQPKNSKWHERDSSRPTRIQSEPNFSYTSWRKPRQSRKANKQTPLGCVRVGRRFLHMTDPRSRHPRGRCLTDARLLHANTIIIIVWCFRIAITVAGARAFPFANCGNLAPCERSAFDTFARLTTASMIYLKCPPLRWLVGAVVIIVAARTL